MGVELGSEGLDVFTEAKHVHVDCALAAVVVPVRAPTGVRGGVTVIGKEPGLVPPVYCRKLIT